jgi:hypothetical protein
VILIEENIFLFVASNYLKTNHQKHKRPFALTDCFPVFSLHLFLAVFSPELPILEIHAPNSFKCLLQ